MLFYAICVLIPKYEHQALRSVSFMFNLAQFYIHILILKKLHITIVHNYPKNKHNEFVYKIMVLTKNCSYSLSYIIQLRYLKQHMAYPNLMECRQCNAHRKDESCNILYTNVMHAHDLWLGNVTYVKVVNYINKNQQLNLQSLLQCNVAFAMCMKYIQVLADIQQIQYYV